MTQRERWHVFHGWVVRCGIHLRDLTPAEFLDLVHHFLLRTTDPKEHTKLTRLLVGRPQAGRTDTVDERAGFVPPTWWRGDDYASRSAVSAMVTMSRSARGGGG